MMNPFRHVLLESETPDAAWVRAGRTTDRCQAKKHTSQMSGVNENRMLGNHNSCRATATGLSSFLGNAFNGKTRLFLALFFVLASIGIFSLVLITTHQAAHADPTINEVYLPQSDMNPWGISFDL